MQSLKGSESDWQGLVSEVSSLKDHLMVVDESERSYHREQTTSFYKSIGCFCSYAGHYGNIWIILG